MAITNAHLHWFKLKCPYPQGSKAFRMAKAKLDNATYADLERLRAEFEMYKDGSSPVTHYNLYDELVCISWQRQNRTGKHEGYPTSWLQVQGSEAHQWATAEMDI